MTDEAPTAPETADPTPAARPLTVDEIAPFLSERGKVEVESAVKSLHITVLQRELEAAKQPAPNRAARRAKR